MAFTRYLIQGKQINPCKIGSNAASWTFRVHEDDMAAYAREWAEVRHPDREVEVMVLEGGVVMMIAHAAMPSVYVVTKAS